MSITEIERPGANGGPSHANLAAGLLALAAWYADDDRAPALHPSVNIPVPGDSQAVREAELKRIARLLGVKVQDRPGMKIAELRFGPWVVEAHVVLRDAAGTGNAEITASAA